MNEVEKLNAYCFALIGICRETNAEEMTVKQENVTHLGKPIGSWEITVRNMDAPEWIIWSHEHQGWWAPNERGYVTSRKAAGRYTYAKALEIVEGANRMLKDAPNEAMVKLTDDEKEQG